ncbi:MAG: hypothetical protein Q9168_005825 [Polycauliona sp. 1 TL-2023]
MYEGEDTSVQDDTDRHDSYSVVNGMEHLNLNPAIDDNVALARSRTHRRPGALKAKSEANVEYTNKTLAPEQTDFMIQSLERKADLRLKRTYMNGVVLDEVSRSAPTLRVALKFLPGADKPQVSRSEQLNMEGKEADQRDAPWRVATAGSLLTQCSISSDLQIMKADQTPSIMARAKHQYDCDGQFSDQRKNLSRSIRKYNSDEVTIDSEQVTLVNDLRNGTWDLRGLLVEVDWSSLWDLIMNYRNIISGGGPDMTFEETQNLLETMIEDARRLCIRSPVLFRMSTRVSIINSEHTRYGINHGQYFKTLITSKGIKEIISHSAAYYNSLDTGSANLIQDYIRPRFLQMIVLLLSLLNNEDLAELKVFLEATYKLKADRRDIELLILKVVPLLSINPQVFLKALIPAIDGFPLEYDNSDTEDAHSHIWNVIMKRILADGYLLPGTVDDLGRKSLSWIVKWPEDGYSSTLIFNNLQYAGRLRALNDIPPVEVHPASDCTELAVVMTDDSKYVINPRDLENIVYMTPGRYPMQETAGTKRCFDLVIEETWLNGDLYQAIKMTNDIVYKVNQWLANPRRGSNKMSRLVRRGGDLQSFLNDFRSPGRLTEVVATLEQATLAVTYKVEGRRDSRYDAIQNMARDIRQLLAFINYIEQRADAIDLSFFGQEKRAVKQGLERVREQINLSEQSRARIGMSQELSNEPIVKTMYPEGRKAGDKDTWNGYKAWCQEHNGYLNIEATGSIIRRVKWLTAGLLEISLEREPSKVFVTPLQPVPEAYQDDEARVGDLAILVGHYLAIGEQSEGSEPNTVFTMTNYMRISSVVREAQSRRGKNRMQGSDQKFVWRFK